jgi:hypothetical protein
MNSRCGSFLDDPEHWRKRAEETRTAADGFHTTGFAAQGHDRASLYSPAWEQ